MLKCDMSFHFKEEKRYSEDFLLLQKIPFSGLHWVKDKERVWSFLGEHQEIIYDGHESNVEAEANLRKAGFTQVLSIGQSKTGGVSCIPACQA